MAGTNNTSNTKKGPPADPIKVDGAPLADLKVLKADLSLPIPTGADPDYRSSLTAKLIAIENYAASTQTDLETNLKKALGAINNLPRQSNPEDQRFKSRAIAVVQSALKVNKVPKKFTAQAPDKAFNEEILKRSDGPVVSFMSWIRQELSPESIRRWNSANVVTAAYTLFSKHPGWERRGAPAFATAKALTEKLTSQGEFESFGTVSMSNLCSTIPHLIQAITLSGSSNDGLDAQLVGALTKIVRTCHEEPNIEYFHKMLFAPLGDCQSVYLTPEGQKALCEYASELIGLTSKVRYSGALEIVGDSFRALKGIASWTNGPEEERHLVETLKGLNDRLSSCAEKFNNQTVVAITSGFQGIDFQKLGPEAQTEIARSFEIIAQGISRMEGNLNAKALGMLLYSLSTALDISSDPMRAPLISLLSEAYQRRPGIQSPEERLTTLSDVGFLCTGLLALGPCTSKYPGMVKALWEIIRKTDYRNLGFATDTEEGVASWATINKTFALYSQQFPAHLSEKLVRLAPSAHFSASKSKSGAEARALEAIETITGASIISKSFIDGWEIDLLIKLPNENFLIVEVDGKHHEEPIKRRTDRKIRDTYLRNRGYDIVRISSLATTDEFRERIEPIVRSATPQLGSALTIDSQLHLQRAEQPAAAHKPAETPQQQSDQPRAP